MSDQQPEPSEALDSLYEALTEIHAHLHEHDQEHKQLLAELERTERDLLDQREAAAKAGERATYERLSKDLAKLTRAWRAATEDPNADPLEEYQYDEQEPDAPTSQAEPTAPTPDRGDDERPASASEPPTAPDTPTPEPADTSASTPDAVAADTGEPDATGASGQAPSDTGAGRLERLRKRLSRGD